MTYDIYDLQRLEEYVYPQLLEVQGDNNGSSYYHYNIISQWNLRRVNGQNKLQIASFTMFTINQVGIEIFKWIFKISSMDIEVEDEIIKLKNIYESGQFSTILFQYLKMEILSFRWIRTKFSNYLILLDYSLTNVLGIRYYMWQKFHLFVYCHIFSKHVEYHLLPPILSDRNPEWRNPQ